MIMQQDIFIDEDGNTHMVYSQMVKYYAEVGVSSSQIAGWNLYRNNINDHVMVMETDGTLRFDQLF